jgi:hypothetical protein
MFPVIFDKYMIEKQFDKEIIEQKKINLSITLAVNSSLNLSKNLHLWQVFSNVLVVKG